MTNIHFEFQQVTAVHLTNVNSRRELHGDEHVPAMDLSMRLEGSNELLNLLDPALRQALYWNAAATAGQETMPEVLAVLPNLRHAILHKRTFKFAKGVRAKGYRLVLDYGLGGDSNVDLADVTVTGWEFECMEGGSVVLRWSVQCAGEQLTSDVRGMLTGLIDETVHIQLIPPATPQIVQGKDRPAVPPAADAGQGNLLDGEGGDGQGGDNPDPDEDPDDEDTPEKALQRAAGGLIMATDSIETDEGSSRPWDGKLPVISGDFETNPVGTRAELERLQALINTPELDDFLRAVHLEAVHQVERWGTAHDRAKRPADWFWLVGYLAGKALHSALAGDTDKARHHCISSAAALYNWHCAIKGVDVRMCPGRSDIAAVVDGAFPGEAADDPRAAQVAESYGYVTHGG